MSVLPVPDQLPRLSFEDATYDKKLEKPSSVAFIILYIIWFPKVFDQISIEFFGDPLKINTPLHRKRGIVN
ncbi:hypothetical protein ES703_86327 [subsurface metagenome]